MLHSLGAVAGAICRDDFGAVPVVRVCVSLRQVCVAVQGLDLLSTCCSACWVCSQPASEILAVTAR